ncbi:hypothetical protein BJY01DRAFT_242634 [Aspergillus pseudoustus]|uniref:GPI-anchored cell wall organization protein Ecm33 n=1 Tax=Aspergillus pseudoustus TaxID=1810923 RepID=A0ABR4KWE9_9EURO
MKYCSTLVIGLGIWDLPLGALARECSTTESEQILQLTSPDQLDVFEGCTIITGHIAIEPSYSGDLILNGVTEFPGNISTSGDSPLGLGLVELPNLVELGAVNLSSVANVHLPKLERAVDIVLVQPGRSGEVDLGSLVEANNVKIRGSWTSINVSSLQTVGQVAQFCGSQFCRMNSNEEYPFISVDLPELVTTNYLELGVSVESVSVPLLEVIGHQEPEVQHVQGLTLNILENTGKDLDFNAPKLHTINGTLEVNGGVSGLSLGALNDGSVGITLNSRASPGLNVYSTLKTPRHLYIWGNLASIYLPSFDYDGTFGFSIDYINDIPCNETLYNLWQIFPNPSADNYCDEIEIQDEEPSDEVPEDTDDTTTDTTITDESNNTGAEGTEPQSGNDDNSEEFVSGDGAGMVLPRGGVTMIAATIISSWFSF